MRATACAVFSVGSACVCPLQAQQDSNERAPLEREIVANKKQRRGFGAVVSQRVVLSCCSLCRLLSIWSISTHPRKNAEKEKP